MAEGLFARPGSNWTIANSRLMDALTVKNPKNTNLTNLQTSVQVSVAALLLREHNRDSQLLIEVIKYPFHTR